MKGICKPYVVTEMKKVSKTHVHEMMHVNNKMEMRSNQPAHVAASVELS